MHRFTVDYRAQEDPPRRRGQLLNRGYFVHDLPRLIPLCRLLGHRPVVDGYENDHGPGARWVCCDRCGVRPDPQGSLDPAEWNLGDHYEMGLGTLDLPTDKKARGAALKSLPYFYRPGPWPTRPTGAFGAQMLVGRHGLLGVGLKVGNRGSEHTLAAHLYLSPLFGIEVHTEHFGQGMQRRLNPTGWESRVIEMSTTPGHLYWRLWAKRDEHSRDNPRWRDGSIRVDPRDILLGEKRYSYEDMGEPVTGTVRLPHGDDHEVVLQLQRQTLGRPRGRRRKESWVVEWDCPGGIPTKPHDEGGVYGSAVAVDESAVFRDDWVNAALAALAVRVVEWRSSYGWRAQEVTG